MLGIENIDREQRKKPYQFYLEGQAIDEDIFINDFYFVDSIIIYKVIIQARTAPEGAAITIDFLKNDVEMGKIMTLSASSKSEITNLSGVVFLTNSKFGLIVKSVGSTNPGGGLSIYLHYWPRP